MMTDKKSYREPTLTPIGSVREYTLRSPGSGDHGADNGRMA